MKTGDTVVCRRAKDGYALTEGSEYTIVEYIPKLEMKNGFTFPAYVDVMNDNNRLVRAHASRFEVKE